MVNGEFLSVWGKHVLLIQFLALCFQIYFLLRMPSVISKLIFLIVRILVLNQIFFWESTSPGQTWQVLSKVLEGTGKPAESLWYYLMAGDYSGDLMSLKEMTKTGFLEIPCDSPLGIRILIGDVLTCSSSIYAGHHIACIIS